jgi:hypothetical protein
LHFVLAIVRWADGPKDIFEISKGDDEWFVLLIPEQANE